MFGTAGRITLAALAMIVLPELAAAQSAPTSTIWDGVYTNAQAERGKTLMQTNCSTCHNVGEWTSSRFGTMWSGRPIQVLHQFLSEAMPLDAPGKLTPKEYSDIVAYMLKLNGVPSGQKELPAETAALSRIQVTGPATD